MLRCDYEPVHQKYLYIKAKKGFESREATELEMPMVEKTAPISLVRKKSGERGTRFDATSKRNVHLGETIFERREREQALMLA